MVKTERSRASASSSSSSVSRSAKKTTKAPKGPPSCLVCKFRRVKCDGVKPECGQCRQVKRVCHGYPEDPGRGQTPASSVSSGSNTREIPASRANVVVKIQPDDDDDEYSSSRSLALRTPPKTPEPDEHQSFAASTLDIKSAVSLSIPTGSSSIASDQISASSSLGVADSVSIPALFNKPERTTPEDCLVHMYRHRTMPALHPLATGGMVGAWRTFIVQAADEDKTLRYVASALATYHDNYLSASQSSSVLANKYYSKGLSSMNSSFGHASLDPDALVHLMMSASVLLGVEYFRRNFGAIRIHLQSIIKVLGERTDSQMTPQLVLAERFFRRTYVYFTFFPALYPNFNSLTREEVTHRSWLPPSLPTTFNSLEDAEVVLHDLFWPYMFFIQSLDRAPHIAKLPQSLTERNALLAAFTTWHNAFEPFCALRYASLAQPQQVEADIYRLWSMMLRLRMTHSLSQEQRPYDAHTAVFKAMVSRAIAIDRRIVRDTRVSLEPMLSYLTPTYFVIIYCRDPRIRRDALAVLNRAKVTHAQWYPPAIVRAGMRIVEIEERGWERKDDTISGIKDEGKRVIIEADDVREEDRIRNVRLHTDIARGVVEIGAQMWMGDKEGWVERTEELNLPVQ